MRARNFVWIAAAPVIALACAKSVRVDGAGGEGGTGQSTSISATVSSAMSSSSSGPCHSAADCAGMADACNDGACVNGVCGKVAANEMGACDDGMFCTDNDTCQGGICVGGTPHVCNATKDCAVGSCDEAGKKCVDVPGNDGASCDDMDPCTQLGTCSGGTCMPGNPVDCSFLTDQCGTGACDPVNGCIKVPVMDGTPCDDQLFCTINDACTAGKCSGAANPCTPMGASICMIGSCDEVNKQCSAVPGNDGLACDDGNDCSVGEKCSAGSCIGGVPGNNGAACDDHNACTGGTTCSNGVCGNAMSNITQCINGDQCCPAGCGGLDNDCLWFVSGVQQNVPPAQLVGWSQCYIGTYDVAFSDAQVNSILAACSQGKLMMTCRQKGAANWQLAAMGLRADVLFDCGMNNSCTHVANGVGWYFAKQWSWGFADAVDQVSRNECDTNAGPLRLCWHTLDFTGGYRCGDVTGLNGDAGWERAVFQAP